VAETGRGIAKLDAVAVVATLDRPDWLARCLASLASADPPYGEIVVVDQSGDQDQRELANAHGARYLHIERRGLSLARNAGIAATGGEWVHFPDDDCTVAPELLAAIAHGVSRQPEVGFVCAHIEVPGGRAIMAGMDGRERAIARPDEVLRTTMSPGLFVRRRVLLRLGGFDERFGIGGRFPSGEESDLLFRALAVGESGRYLPQARVFHPDQFALRDPEAQRRRAFEYGRGWGALFAKHTPEAAAFAALHRRYLLRAALGVAFAAVTGRPALARRYAASFQGRRRGWREWRGLQAGPATAATQEQQIGAAPRLELSPVLANTGGLVALRATHLASRLLLLLVIAGQSDPHAFGRVIFALSVAEIGKVLADFGMDALAIREYAAERAPETHARFAASLAAAKLLLGGVVYLALGTYWSLSPSREQAALGWIFATTVVTALTVNFSLDFFQARLRVGRVLRPALLVTTGVTLAAALLLPRIADLRLQVAFFPLIEAITALVLLARLRDEGLVSRPVLAFGAVLHLIRRSLPIALTAFLIMTYSRLDVLVLSSRLDAAAVGYYGIAFRLSEPFQMAAAAFGLSVFSRFSTWFQAAGATSLRGPALRYVLGTLGYGVVTAVVLALLVPPVIERFFPGYAPAIPILRILAAALVFRTLNATLAGVISGAGHFGWLTGIAAWNLVFFFALLHGLVGRWQMAGAALALLIGEAVNSVLQLALVTRIVSPSRRSPAHGR
jgi:O-antigen/teichoic acid export membrane protein/GT2 family glycosyltransferase